MWGFPHKWYWVQTHISLYRELLKDARTATSTRTAQARLRKHNSYTCTCTQLDISAQRFICQIFVQCQSWSTSASPLHSFTWKPIANDWITHEVEKKKKKKNLGAGRCCSSCRPHFLRSLIKSIENYCSLDKVFSQNGKFKFRKLK